MGDVRFVAYLVTLLAIAEGLVRLSGIASRHVPDRAFRYGDADLPYVYAPNLRDARGWGDTRFNTDALGLRSAVGGEPVVAKSAGEWRIALVGDSVTFGEGVATADVFAQRLQERLGPSGVRVFNFGVSGYSVRQVAATVERRVAAIAPDLVVVTLVPADFELSRMGALDPWGSVRPTGGSDTVEWLKMPVRRLHLAYALLDLARGPRASWQSVPIVDVPRSFAYVAGLRSACAVRGFACGLVLLSVKIDDGFGPVAEPLRTLGLPVLDLTHVKDAFTTEAFEVGPYDPHPSAAVHRQIADALVPWIAELRGSAERRGRARLPP